MRSRRPDTLDLLFVVLALLAFVLALSLSGCAAVQHATDTAWGWISGGREDLGKAIEDHAGLLALLLGLPPEVIVLGAAVIGGTGYGAHRVVKKRRERKCCKEGGG